MNFLDKFQIFFKKETNINFYKKIEIDNSNENWIILFYENYYWNRNLINFRATWITEIFSCRASAVRTKFRFFRFFNWLRRRRCMCRWSSLLNCWLRWWLADKRSFFFCWEIQIPPRMNPTPIIRKKMFHQITKVITILMIPITQKHGPWSSLAIYNPLLSLIYKLNKFHIFKCFKKINKSLI